MPDPNCAIDGCVHAPGFVIRCGYDVTLGKASVGPGWTDLIDWAFQLLPPGVRIVQVKEKFGGLRIYTEPHDVHYQRQVVDRLTAAADKTCFVCGDPGEQGEHGFSVACTRCHAIRDETGRWPDAVQG